MALIDILFSLAGLVFLIKGKLNITDKIVVSGMKVRLLGALYLLSFPIGYFSRLYVFKSSMNLFYAFAFPALLILITIGLVIVGILSKRHLRL